MTDTALPISKLAQRTPPHSLEAEQSVLGGIMQDYAGWEKISDRINENDFYHPQHRTIFKIMNELVNQSKPIDLLTVSEALRSKQLLQAAGGENYLFELVKNVPIVEHIGDYADIIRERSLLRKLIDASHQIGQQASQPGGMSVAEILENAEQKIFSIAQSGTPRAQPLPIQTFFKKAVDHIQMLSNSESHITGLPTGFTDLDDKTSGLQKSDLIIIAGRPSMGKTMFAMNIVEHAAIKSRQGVLVFSMEMPGEALANRMIASLGQIELQRLRSGRLKDEDWPRITSAQGLLHDARIFIDDSSALSPAEIRSRARRIIREQGEIGLIVIDYLQLMQVPGLRENRIAEISEISRSLKSLARELNIPIIALSQLNRGLEQRHDKRPVMSDLRESGAIEQDADVIAFLYRDEVYNENSEKKGICEVIIAKQRNGPIGKVELTFQGQYTRFQNHLPKRMGYEQIS